jgi:hypothetical protein
MFENLRFAVRINFNANGVAGLKPDAPDSGANFGMSFLVPVYGPQRIPDRINAIGIVAVKV